MNASDNNSTVDALNLSNREAVVERLRASKEVSDRQMFAMGVRSGRTWAANFAEAQELERLENARDQVGLAWDETFQIEYSGNDSAASHFLRIISDDETIDGPSVDDFWGDHGFDHTPSASYVQGFADGALDVWDDVANEL